jgi:hypothetical protein
VPIIAVFNGIIVQMFFEDHGPPHIDAIYSGAKALVRISDGEIIRRRLPAKQAKLLKGWVNLRRAELIENWHHAQTDAFSLNSAR